MQVICWPKQHNLHPVIYEPPLIGGLMLFSVFLYVTESLVLSTELFNVAGSFTFVFRTFKSY